MLLFFTVPVVVLHRYRNHMVLRNRYPMLLVLRSLGGIWLTTNWFRTSFPVLNAAYQDLGTPFYYVEMTLNNVFLPIWLLVVQMRSVLGLYEFRTTTALLQSSWRVKVNDTAGPSKLELFFFRVLSGALDDENYRWLRSAVSAKRTAIKELQEGQATDGAASLPATKYVASNVTNGRLMRLQVCSIVAWVFISVVSVILFLNVPGLNIRSSTPWRFLPLYVELFFFQATALAFWVAIRRMWRDTVYIRRELIACIINFTTLFLVHVVFLFRPSWGAKVLGPYVTNDIFPLIITIDCHVLLTVSPLLLLWHRERQLRRFEAQFPMELHRDAPSQSLSRTSSSIGGSSGASLLHHGSRAPSFTSTTDASPSPRASGLSMESMISVLCDPEQWTDFKQVIAREYCMENALFVEQMMAIRASLHGRASISTPTGLALDACAMFNATQLPPQVDSIVATASSVLGVAPDADVRARVRALYDRFVDVNSPCELNLSCSVREEVRYHVRGGDLSPEILEPVLDEVLRMLYLNSFPRYVRQYAEHDSLV
ncbi:hypothetical protein RI367_005004 [Sorochytrium milnesiophthora]